MAMTVSDIEKKYAAIMRAQNSPISFGEYIKGKTDGIELNVNEKKLDALTGAERKLSRYGKLAESLEVRGLTDSGFAKYAHSAVSAKKDAALKQADKEGENAMKDLKSDYLGYIDDFNGKQQTLRKSVINELISRGEMNPESIYKYAADAGLGEEAGKDVYNDVYSAASYYIKDSILKDVASGALSPDQAVDKAKRMLLWPEDVEEIRVATESYRKKEEEASSEYLSSLEALSDKTTDSYPFGIRLLYKTILQKERK